MMRRVRSTLMLLGLGLALTGCMLVPAYRRPSSSVASQFPGVTASATSTATANVAAADLGWRDFISDLRLQRLIELALANNRDLRIAMLNVEQSRAQYRVTRSSLAPIVGGSGSYSASRMGSTSASGFGSNPAGPAGSNTTSRQWSASVGLSSYELDFFGRLRSLNQQALEQFFATQEARRNAQISLVSEVATQYFTLREAEAQFDLAQQTLRSVQSSYDLNKTTFDAGESNEMDLRTSEGQVQTARINGLIYERQRTQALNNLELLLGTALPADLPAPSAFDSPTLLAAIPAGLPSDLIERRADILEAEDTLKAANANIGAARAAFFPSISLTSSIGSTSTQLSGLFGAGSGSWSFAPQITLPIFTGGKNGANLDVARIATRIDVATYEKAIQTAFREVVNALVADSTYADQIDAETSAIGAQQRRLELATLRYRQGEDSYLNVLSAQQDLYSAQQGRLEAQFNRLSSHISLYQALGGGWK